MTICITVKNAKLIQRYLLRSGLLDILAQRGARVILLAPEQEADIYRNEFIHDRIQVVGLPLFSPKGILRFISGSPKFLVSDLSFIRYTKYKYACGAVSFFQLCSKILAIHFFNIFPVLLRLGDKALKHFANLFFKTPEILQEVFDTYHPDLVFATSLAEVNFDVPILIEARRRGVLTAGTARGWSSIGGNTRFLAEPDLWLVQNKFMKEMAMETQYVAEKNVYITGFPYFDWFVKGELISSREDFFNAIGIDPQKRVILYAGSGEAIAEREVGFARIFDRLVREGKIPSDVAMLFRPHPYHATAIKEISQFQSGKWKSVFLDSVELQNMKRPASASSDMGALVHLINSFVHCDMVLTPGGTVYVEAAAFKKPLVALAFDGDMEVPYWLSFARRYDGTHFEHKELLKSGAIKKVTSEDELASAINKFLTDPRRESREYKNLRERFVEPFDGMSTERLADLILKFAEIKSI